LLPRYASSVVEVIPDMTSCSLLVHLKTLPVSARVEKIKLEEE
jgi:hypothetical protein